MDKIRELYRPYFSKLSLRLMKNEYGNVRIVVDGVLRGCLESSLSTMSLNFLIRKLLLHGSVALRSTSPYLLLFYCSLTTK